MPYIVAVLAGYLIGSVPFAYLLVRWRRQIDLHTAGSTNVGASNALATTGSRRIGVAVLVLDALKGLAATLVGLSLAQLFEIDAGTPQFWMQALGVLGAVTGHNYNLWLSRKAGRLAGGKGLATGAGGFLLLTPGLVPAWGILFVLGRWTFEQTRGIRDVIPGNVFATALLPFAAWLLYGSAANLAIVVFAALALPKHARQMQALWRGEPIRAHQSGTPSVQNSMNGGASP